MRRAWLIGALTFVVAACGTSAERTGDGRTSALDPATSSPAISSEAPSTSSASTPSTLQTAFETVRSGVVRFEVAQCGGNVQGSGFALSETLVATVAHVVDQGQVVRVIQGTMSTAGTVIGVDQRADVALVKTATPLDGNALAFAATGPAVGDEVAALGFPEGQPLSYNPGTVNGLGRKAEIEGFVRHDLLEMDAATQHGSSGGPVIRADGTVAGLVDAGPSDNGQGQRLAVSSATAKSLIDGWLAEPEQIPLADCATVHYPDGSAVSSEAVPTRDDMQAVTTLSVYFRAVNSGDFATALAQLTDPGSLESFSANVASTLDDAIRYRSVQDDGSQLVVWVTFTSQQDIGKGPPDRPQETCTDWSLDYVMARMNGLWLIDGARPHDGRGNAPCAASATDGNAPSSEPTPSSGAPTPTS